VLRELFDRGEPIQVRSRLTQPIGIGAVDPPGPVGVVDGGTGATYGPEVDFGVARRGMAPVDDAGV
jgi:hypothetical protein